MFMERALDSTSSAPLLDTPQVSQSVPCVKACNYFELGKHVNV